GNLVARQSLQGEIRHLLNLSFRIVECGEQSGDHFLGAERLQTQNGIHAIRHLSRVQVIEEQLVSPRVVKESERPQDVPTRGVGALGEHLRQRRNRRWVAFLRQQEQ